MTRDELAAAIAGAAYLEGDFVLRSGRRSRYYLDKYRFETRPDLLRPIGDAIAAAVSQHAPEATKLAGPELGAVALAAAASLAGGLPFLIVRGAAKEYGTGNRLEGVFERGSRCASSRTSSPRAERRSRPWKRCGKPASRCGTLCVSSTGKRAVSTPSLAPPCGSSRSSARPSFGPDAAKARAARREPAKSARGDAQIGSVERYPTDGVVTLTRRVLTPKSPNRRIR